MPGSSFQYICYKLSHSLPKKLYFTYFSYFFVFLSHFNSQVYYQDVFYIYIKTSIPPGNGKMDFTDFVEMMAQDKLVLTTSEQEILAAFQFLDQNQDGYITVDELLQRFHGCLSDTEASRLMCEADANGDGKIDFEGRLSPSRLRCFVVSVVIFSFYLFL